MLTNDQIVNLFRGGYTINGLTAVVRSDSDMECRNMKEARAVVERVLYEEHMKMIGKWKPEYSAR